MREKYLDSLRGIACLIVLLAHIIATDVTFGMYASGCGKIGVWFFMVLSGFLLVQRYLCRDDKFYIRKLPDFYSKKLLRMLPAYFFSVVITIVLGMFDMSQLLSHFLLQNAWGHFWYMPVIIKFYFLAPFVLILLSTLKRKGEEKGIVLFSIFIVGLGIVCCVMFPWNTYGENSISLAWYIPVFCMGILLAVLMRKIKFKHSFADIVSFIPLVAIMSVTPVFRKWIWNVEPDGYLQNKYLYMGLMWCLFIFFVSKGVYLKKFLDNNKVLQKIGDYSYDIYLIHYVVLHKLVAVGVFNTWIRGAVTVMISFAYAVILELLRKKWNCFVSVKTSLRLTILLWFIVIMICA